MTKEHSADEDDRGVIDHLSPRRVLSSINPVY